MPDAASDGTPSTLRAEVEHRIPGRLRMRVRAKRGDAGFFQRVEAALARVSGVRSVRANPQTGSILVEHGGDERAVLAATRDQGLVTAEPANQSLAVFHAGASWSGGVAPVPSSPFDLAALGLATAGLMQLARGQVVGSAAENLWNAYGLYAVTRQPLPSAFLVAFGLFQIARGEVLGSAVSLFLYAYSARRMARHRAAEETI
jgi:hypothetical protein